MINLCTANAITGKNTAAEDLKGKAAAAVRIREALEQYRNAGTGFRLENISDKFCRKLAAENWEAKATLRKIFRNHENWDEATQEIVVEIPINQNEEFPAIVQEIKEFVWQYGQGGINFKRTNAVNAVNLIENPKDEYYQKCYQDATGHPFNANRKITKSVREILQAAGAWSDAAGSECQVKFAEWANILTSANRPRQLHISICPAIQLTQSNPHEDDRGPTLISCHSLDNRDYGYNAGNCGYALDTVTFVAYTCRKDDRYTRKTSRQLYMYQDGTLIQSRLYDCNGCNDHGGIVTDTYRQTVQQIIADCLNTPNVWTEPVAMPVEGIYEVDRRFGGYPDFIYSTTGCTVSRLAGFTEISRLHIGAQGYCISCCGSTTSKFGAVCKSCFSGRICEICGDEIEEDEGVETDEGLVCEYCREHNDFYWCEGCMTYTRRPTYWVDCWNAQYCESCIDEEGFEYCDYCDMWHGAGETQTVRVCSVYWYPNGHEISVCPSCLESLQEDGRIIEDEKED